MSGAILDLGTNSLKFTNTSSVVRTMSQTILEALYNGATSWVTINCMGTLYGWDSTAVACMDVVVKINYIITHLQQTNTLLNNTIDAEDALALQVFKQTAGQGSGLGGELV